MLAAVDALRAKNEVDKPKMSKHQKRKLKRERRKSRQAKQGDQEKEGSPPKKSKLKN